MDCVFSTNNIKVQTHSLVSNMLTSSSSEENPHAAQECGELKKEGGRKRKRAGPPKDAKLFKQPLPGPAARTPRPRPGCPAQRCLAVGSRAWAPGRDGWLEPRPLQPGRRTRRRGWRSREEGGEEPQESTPAAPCPTSTPCPTSSPRPGAAARRCRPRLEKQYAKGSLLGRGGYGSVYAGTRKSDGLPVAIKYVSKAQAEEELDIPGQDGPLPLEVALMKQVTEDPGCPHVLRMLDWFDQPARYVMVLERPEPCQDLISFCQDRGGFVSESTARRITGQLLGALRHCGERGVLHRDVKPENLLIRTDSHQVKLIDFGCGDLLKNTMYKDFAGTLEYTPPEWFRRGQYQAGPATVWSVGVTLFNLVCGSLPFNSIREIIRGRVSFPTGISAECRHLIRWCLSAKAADRPSLEQIQLHEWLT
ncbi:serine/threonine-protein kinase pim-1-like [Centroberyx affinis]|uniref:serine/threonine-protein kinase pim-1-like n=1 Tax=Centroberyx affinis TaxID=166261 RepID=UPI003A5BC157